MPQPGEPFNPFGIFTGAFIPNVVMQIPWMRPAHKLVWARLAQYAVRSGWAYARQDTLAEQVGLKPRYIRHVLLWLERHKFIRIRHPKGGSRMKHAPNMYQFLWHEAYDVALHNPQGWSTPEDDVPQTNMTPAERPPVDGLILQDTKYTTAPRAASRRRVGVKRKATDPRVKQFIDQFCEEYQQRLGRKYIVQGGRDGMTVKRLLQALDRQYDAGQATSELMKAAVHMMSDQWGSSRASIGLLSSQINAWHTPSNSATTHADTPGQAGRSPDTIAARYSASKRALRWCHEAKDRAAEVAAEGREVDYRALAVVLGDVSALAKATSTQLSEGVSEWLYYPGGKHIATYYAKWIAVEIVRWPSWNGNLEGFLPGGKHWWRFLKDHQDNMGWKLSRRELEVIRAATQS